MATGGRVERRLAWYWQAEVANVVLGPAVWFMIAHLFDQRLGWPSVFALVPACGLLAVGGLYWRGKLHALRGDGRALDFALALADRTERALVILTLLALVLTVVIFVLPLPAATEGDRWGVSIAALLALAEYVNYYQRQLQHFDNWPDFKRLITGRGLRPAKMAVDLAAWRAAQRSGSEA